MDHLRQLENEVSTWPNVSVHPHRFGGKEFRFGKAEIGHVHRGGTVDIPFPRAVRDALLEEGQAEEHRWAPNSGWATFEVRREADVAHAIELKSLTCVLAIMTVVIIYLTQKGAPAMLSLCLSFLDQRPLS
jgi:hypothetical protein